MIIKILAEGGNMKPGPALSQKLGPLGINMGKVISEINNATGHLKGMKIPVELDVDTKTKEFNVKVFMPPVSEMIKKELKIEKGAGKKGFKAGNISFEQIISIAKQKQEELLVNDLKAAVRTVVGTCVSLGVLVENKEAKDVEQEIEQGQYDEMIQQEKTELDPEKKKQLNQYFSDIQKKQDEIVKKEEADRASKEAKEEKKAKAAAAPKPAAGKAGKK